MPSDRGVSEVKFVSDPSQPLMRLIQNVTLTIDPRLRGIRLRVLESFIVWLFGGLEQEE